MTRYYLHDLETEKLHIHTGGKSDWLTIPESDREAIKRACLWSNRLACWVSRRKGGKAHILAGFYPGDVLARNGFTDRGETGERLTFAEKVEATQERAADRAERMEDRAGLAAREARARFDSPNVQTLRGLQGEPVKIGHPSQHRHERLIDRADNDMRKGCEAVDKAKHYERRAECARATADGAQYSDPRYLGNRIKEREKEERDLLRKLASIDDRTDRGPDVVDWLWRLLDLLADVQDKLGYFRHCLATCGRTVYDRAALKGKTEVLIRGTWEKIVKLNPTTVAVPNICFPTEESQRKYALKYAYTEVKDAR